MDEQTDAICWKGLPPHWPSLDFSGSFAYSFIVQQFVRETKQKPSRASENPRHPLSPSPKP